MKRFIISFFSILLITLASVGGGLLLSACDNSSYSENAGREFDNSQNENDTVVNGTATGYWTNSGNYDTSWSGAGTETSPYLISTEEELAGLSYMVNNGTNYSGNYFIQTKDLDMSAYWWDAIGYSSSRCFAGHYNGDGYIIYSLFTRVGSSSTYSYQGLFGYIKGTSSTNQVEISNIGIVNSNIQGYQYIGGIVGYSDSLSTITNCYNTGSVTGTASIGGVVGYNSSSSTISNCYNTGSVTGTASIGGVVGTNYLSYTVNNCYNTGSVTGSSAIGGVVGYNYSSSTVSNCYNTGLVRGDLYFGGVVGANDLSTLTNCYYGGNCNLNYGIGSSSHSSGDNTGTTKISSLNSTSYAKSQSWYTNSSNWDTRYPWDFTYVWSFISGQNDDYPVFKKITITYNSNFGDYETYVYNQRAGTTIIKDNVFSRENYQLTHYNTNNNGTGASYIIGESYLIASDIEIYAIWQANTYTVSFNTNGGTGISDKIVTFDSVYGTLESPTKEGYTFNGWYLKSEFTGTPIISTSKVTTPSDHTLYAKWEANTYTVTFNSNGGDIIKDKTVTFDSTYGTLDTPWKNGFIFEGWYLNSNFIGNEITSTTKVTTAENHTLYAKWKAKNPARYDEENGYWYVEMGYYPQTRATQTEINGITNTNGATYTINGTDVTSKIGANSIEYCQYNGVWYKVEPVRYILNTSLINETSFDGNDFINLGRKYMYTDAITVSLWAYMDNWADYGTSSGDGNMRLISCTEGGGWNIESSDDNNIHIVAYDKGVGYKGVILGKWTTLSSGWHHFAFTFDGEYLKGYLDGELKGTSSKFESGEIAYNSTNSIFIGAEPNNSATTPYGQYFKGKIRSVFIYNNSLSKDEILDLKSKDFYSGFGTEEGNYLAVTEKVVFASAWSSTKLSLGDGYTLSTLRTNISDFVSDSKMNTDYTGARSYTIENFKNVNGTSADTTLSVDIIASNDSEIESIFGDLSAEFSDLVSDILGNNLMYWTRDVGSNLNTAECITRLGSPAQSIMQKILGVRLTANVSTFGCL